MNDVTFMYLRNSCSTFKCRNRGGRGTEVHDHKESVLKNKFQARGCPVLQTSLSIRLGQEALRGRGAVQVRAGRGPARASAPGAGRQPAAAAAGPGSTKPLGH